MINTIANDLTTPLKGKMIHNKLIAAKKVVLNSAKHSKSYRLNHSKHVHFREDPKSGWFAKTKANFASLAKTVDLTRYKSKLFEPTDFVMDCQVLIVWIFLGAQFFYLNFNQVECRAMNYFAERCAWRVINSDTGDICNDTETTLMKIKYLNSFHLRRFFHFMEWLLRTKIGHSAEWEQKQKKFPKEKIADGLVYNKTPLAINSYK